MKMHIFARSIIGLLCLLAHGTLYAQATLSPAEQEVWLGELKQVEFMNAGAPHQIRSREPLTGSGSEDEPVINDDGVAFINGIRMWLCSLRGNRWHTSQNRG